MRPHAACLTLDRALPRRGTSVLNVEGSWANDHVAPAGHAAPSWDLGSPHVQQGLSQRVWQAWHPGAGGHGANTRPAGGCRERGAAQEAGSQKQRLEGQVVEAEEVQGAGRGGTQL